MSTNKDESVLNDPNQHAPKQPAPDQTDGAEALIAALVQIEHHVTAQGWDQPARLFALVRTDELIRREPSLAEHLQVSQDDALSSIEQEDFHAGGDVLERLGSITWPASVTGCAIALERAFLPPRFESEIPADPADAERFVAEHPHKQDIRVVVGALRDGSHHGVARLLSHPEELLGGVDLVPGLAAAVGRTLQ